MTTSLENYLKSIYLLSANDQPASGKALAEKLSVSPAAVTDMTRKLARKGLVHYSRYQGILLTDHGMSMALSVLRKHRLWELFLVNTLGLSWDEVHREAENLEHISSDFLIDKIDKHLGYPKYDPHGAPIPDKSGKLTLHPSCKSLQDVTQGKSYRITMVDDTNHEFLTFITKKGISLGNEILVREVLSFDGTIVIDCNNQSFSLSRESAGRVFVTPLIADSKTDEPGKETV